MNRAHFCQRLDEVMEDLRTTWGVLGKYWVSLPVATLKEKMGLG